MKIKFILIFITLCFYSCGGVSSCGGIIVPPPNTGSKIKGERNPCKADETCQNKYDRLLDDAYQKITIDSLRTTESLNQAKQILEKAKLNECGECLDIQKSKWDNIYSKSEEGYKSSESIVKDYNDSDHKLRMERYKALMEISKNAIQK